MPAERISGPPDFVGVGAQRSGTTWWFQLLLRHPSIVGPAGRSKEVHFFDRFSSSEMSSDDVAEYHRLFERGPGQVAGEWTPRYMYDVATPRALRRAAPDARLLVMLRDPIERFRSGVVHRLSRGPDRSWEMSAADAIERGRYARQLRRLLALYDERAILVLQYEKCREDPSEQYARTLRFLGLEEGFEPKAFHRQRGTTMEGRKAELWPDLRDAVRATLEPDVEALRSLVPELELELWPNFAHLAAPGAPR